MALALKDFTHTFFTTATPASADGTVVWSSTPYAAAATEKVQACLVKVAARFANATTGDLKIHVRKNADTNVNTEHYAITNPGTTADQIKEFSIFGPFSKLDIGIENESTAVMLGVDVGIVDGTKLTGVDVV